MSDLCGTVGSHRQSLCRLRNVRFVAIALALFSPLFASDADAPLNLATKVDALFAGVAQTNQPGAAVLIARNGVHTIGKGLRVREG